MKNESEWNSFAKFEANIGTNTENPTELFQMVDIDGSGTVTSEELLQMIENTAALALGQN